MEQKTVQDITRMIQVLRQALADLPDQSAFGDSNAGEKAEIGGWIRELEAYRNAVANDEYPHRDPENRSEVIAWLHGEFSYLNDFTS